MGDYTGDGRAVVEPFVQPFVQPFVETRCRAVRRYDAEPFIRS